MRALGVFLTLVVVLAVLGLLLFAGTLVDVCRRIGGLVDTDSDVEAA